MKIIYSLLIVSFLYAGNYENGIEFYKKAQYKDAMDKFMIAAKNNNNKAMLAIAIMYINGDGVKKDQDEALKWFEKAANAKNSYAYIKLGNIYAAKEDYKNAFKWFEKAANNGDIKAAYNLGYFYTGGLGVTRDLKKSLQWYEKAAIAGNIDAQLNLGFMYIAGHGTKVDYKKAAYWIKKAKDTGSQKAQTMWDEFKLGDHI
jgi:TPR repeat protein